MIMILNLIMVCLLAMSLVVNVMAYWRIVRLCGALEIANSRNEDSLFSNYM